MMNLARTSMIAAAILSLVTALPAYSKTPDGLTPAEESVCDVLSEATPGLYGLCVAYCEAHDADLISLYGDANELPVRDRKILDNYNRKKKASDPDMPCVLKEPEPPEPPEPPAPPEPPEPPEPPVSCACWTPEQLAELMPPGNNYDFNYPHACENSSASALIENFEFGMDGPAFQLNVVEFEGCFVTKYNGHVDGPADGAAFLTPDEEASCRAMLADHARNNSTHGVVWDCFDE